MMIPVSRGFRSGDFRGKNMQVIQELPEVFEAFAEQRQKSFLTVKE